MERYSVVLVGERGSGMYCVSGGPNKNGNTNVCVVGGWGLI